MYQNIIQLAFDSLL
jgi:hypothetical protein